MFQTSEVRCEVQKLTMKFTNQFVKLAFDWLLYNVYSQSQSLFTNLLVNSIVNFRASQRTSEVRNILVKS